jgi:hypothetical protein
VNARDRRASPQNRDGPKHDAGAGVGVKGKMDPGQPPGRAAVVPLIRLAFAFGAVLPRSQKDGDHG